MNALYSICKKLYGRFFDKKTSEEKTISQYKCGICIRLTEDKKIDILCELPNLDSLDTDQLILLSEKYAELLLFMNKGLLKREVFDILDNYKKQTNKTILTLFIDNIISFYSLLNIEYKKIRQEKNNSIPMIKPMSVFKTH